MRIEVILGEVSGLRCAGRPALPRNRRLVNLTDTGDMTTSQVTFQYRTSDTGQLKLCTLSAEAFIHRFLQHVLPKGFVESLP